MRNRKFQQAKVYRWLKANGPATSAQVGQWLGIESTAACHLMLRMIDKGAVTRSGTHRRTIWAATDAAPFDARGTHCNSTLGLERGWDVWHKGLAAAARAKGFAVTFSRTQPAKGVVQKRREGTPGEVPAIPSLVNLLG